MREAPVWDPLFWLRLQRTAQAYARTQRLSHFQFLHQRRLLKMLLCMPTGEALEELIKQEDQLARTIFEMMFHYTPETHEQSQQRIADVLAHTWSEVFGDVSDPAVQARIDAAAKELTAQAKRARR